MSITEEDINNVKKDETNSVTDVINEMTALKLEDCFGEQDDVLKCKFCPGIYKKGPLINSY